MLVSFFDQVFVQLFIGQFGCTGTSVSLEQNLYEHELLNKITETKIDLHKSIH